MSTSRKTKTTKATTSKAGTARVAAAKRRRRDRTSERQARKRPIDWARLSNASRELADWALDVAARSVEDFPEDMAKIEHVRNFAHAQLAGVPCAKPSDEDILFVLGLLITELEVDCGIPGVREAVERQLEAILDRQYRAPWVEPAIELPLAPPLAPACVHLHRCRRG